MRRLAPLALLAVVTALAPSDAAGQLIGPSPYVRFADSPFAPLSGWSYFRLETFEDHLFNVPGVSASAGGVTSVVFGPSIHDSVDEDDGAIDGSGLQGDDFFSSDGPSGITFTFDAALLGALPTHAGLVWTDGWSPTYFEAWDQNGVSLGSLSGTHPNMSFNGETDEDRFYGAVNAGGISRIFIKNAPAGIEIDHLQYGNLGTTTTPEPATWGLVAAGLGALAAVRRRRPS
jgi:MYXO-CTERM domain-containing protein